MGDKTPADLILFAATDLKADNSSLTGESEPQDRRGLPDGSKNRAVEAENLVSSPKELLIRMVAYKAPSSFSTRHSLSVARAGVVSIFCDMDSHISH